MSQVVNDAMPIAENLIRGATFVDLDQRSQLALANWIALACIVAEFTHPSSQAIPLSDRQHLQNNFKPPLEWMIFVAPYKAGTWSPYHYKHRGGPMVVRTNEEIHYEQFFQTTTYVLGGLAIHAISSTEPEFLSLFRQHHVPSGMLKIWPTANSQNWAAFDYITDETLNKISQSFALHLTTKLANASVAPR